MNMHLTNSDTIPVKEFTSADELLKHARTRKSLWDVKPKPKAQEVMKTKEQRERDEEVESLKSEVERLCGEVERLSAEKADMYVQMSRLAAFDITKKRKVVDIIEEELKKFSEITVDDIVGAKRTSRLVEARHHCMYSVYLQRPDMSYPEMARVFKRDHTTFIFAVRKMAQRAKHERWSDKP